MRDIAFSSRASDAQASVAFHHARGPQSSLLDKKPAVMPAGEPMDIDSAEKTADEARKEEEDVLVQAEIWMAIARQSKQEGSTGTSK